MSMPGQKPLQPSYDNAHDSRLAQQPLMHGAFRQHRGTRLMLQVGSVL